MRMREAEKVGEVKHAQLTDIMLGTSDTGVVKLGDYGDHGARRLVEC